MEDMQVPENTLPLDEGQKASADDSPSAQRIVINWMVDSNDTIRLRPGIVNTQLDPGTYNVTTGTNTGLVGVYVWKNAIDGIFYAVYVRRDRTVYAKNLSSNFTTPLSTADLTTQVQGTGTVTFAEDSLRLVMAGGGALQQWTGSGLTSRLATYTLGVNQPPQAGTHVVSIGNYLVANDTTAGAVSNQILWSNLGDGSHTSWNPLNFNTADADPDPVVAVGATVREVLAFGTKTTQVFALASDPNLPFASAASINIGCAAPYSIVRRDSDFAWLDETRRFVVSNGRSVISMTGTSSSSSIGDDISKLIRDMTTVSDCFGFRLRMSFWDLLVWVFPTEQKTFVYDQHRHDWRQWRGWNGTDDYSGLRISCYAAHPTANLHIVGDPNFENLWTLVDNVQTDSGPNTPIVAERITERLDWGTASRKRCRRVRFFVKRGQTSNTASEAAHLDVAKRDDDGPWSGNNRLDLGQQGDYSSFRDWYPGGIYTRRQYRIRYSGGVDTSITKAVELWLPHGVEEEAA